MGSAAPSCGLGFGLNGADKAEWRLVIWDDSTAARQTALKAYGDRVRSLQLQYYDSKVAADKLLQEIEELRRQGKLQVGGLRWTYVK